MGAMRHCTHTGVQLEFEVLVFLKLYLAHLIADFLLQPNRIAKNKRRPRALIEHSAIHIATALAIVNVSLNARVGLAVVLLAIAHAGCDYAKARFTKDKWAAFAVDQLVHFVLVVIAAVWLTEEGWTLISLALQRAMNGPRLYLFSCFYVAVVFGGGYFVQKVTSYFMEKIHETLKESKPGLPAAGKYIGWLERALILTFLVTGNAQSIGLLIAAKTLVRYPEIKDDTKAHFAEYFLIGTLTSVSLALVAGLALIELNSYF